MTLKNIKHNIKIFVLTAFLLCGHFAVAINSKATFAQIESGFTSIPDSIQTSVYWYWMSENISKEGVVKDLEAMKRVGINRAFIGSIGGQKVPYGNVNIFSTNGGIFSIQH